MEITEEIISELKKDDGHTAHFNYFSPITKKTRIEFIIDSIKNLNVENIVHVGCAGHVVKIQEQIASSKHLHSALVSNFTNVIGFDTNNEAIALLKKYKIDNVFCTNFLDSENVLKITSKYFYSKPFLILIPDMLEHLDNPVNFLQEIKTKYSNYCKNIVISVPNAYGYQRISSIFKENMENINSDHRYMFAPTTILKIIVKANLTPVTLDFVGFFDDFPIENNMAMLGHTMVVYCKL